jgi:hypothetical protein
MFYPDLYFHDGCPWMYPDHLSLLKKIEIYSNMLNVKENDLPKVLCLVAESRYMRPHAENHNVIINKDKFKLILTHDEEILSQCNNAIFMPFGTTWISKDDWHGNMLKEYGVSFLCGNKLLLEGHYLRHSIWKNQKDIKMPKYFFNSSSIPMPNSNNPMLSSCPTSKIELMKCQFHIAIENCQINNYFTEKIIDCFITKTIPVYRGCPNIKDFFNIKGMFLFQDENDLLDILNRQIKDTTYESMAECVEENYNLCKQYCVSIQKRLEEIINKNIDRL